MIHDHMVAEPGVTEVDYSDAFLGTPAPQQLQQYDIVFAFSDNDRNDATAVCNGLL